MGQNNSQDKKLYRSRTNRFIFGVGGGLGEYFNLDPIIFRIIFVVLTLGGGSGVIIYLLLAFLIPQTPLAGVSEKEPHAADVKDRVEGLVAELKEFDSPFKKTNMLGAVIIIFGAFLLLNQLLPWRIFSWHFFWPVLIILLGVLILTRRREYSEVFDDIKKEPALEIKADGKEKIKEIHHYHYKNRGGIFRLFFGLILLIIGFGYLAQSMNVMPGFNFDWLSLWRFWPVLIILAGLSMISRGTWLGSLLSIFITLGIVLFLVYYFMWPVSSGTVETFTFDIPKEENITRAEIFVQAGAAVVDMSGGGTSLTTGELESNVSNLETSFKTDDGVQRARIEMKSDLSRRGGKLKNVLNFKLAEDIPLSLNLESGASSLSLDASNLILEELKLNAGASKATLYLGDKATTSRVTLNAGASSIEITLPLNVGAKIEVQGALSQKNFADFNQTGGGTYETDDYATAAKKLNIAIDAGVSSITVTRK